MFWWYFWGVIMFLITLFVHKHTYEWGYKNSLSCPLWAVIVAFSIFLCPIVNLTVFIVGGLAYLIFCFSEAIYFEIDWDKQPKWIRKIIMFMTKEI